MTGTDVPTASAARRRRRPPPRRSGRRPAAPAVSPDGQRIAFVVATIDLDENTHHDAGSGSPGRTATRRRSRPARTTPTRRGRPTAASWPSLAAWREGEGGDAARPADRRPRRGAHGRDDARRPRRRRRGRPTASGSRSPAAPATPATRPRTSAGSRRARSRRSSPGSTARAGSFDRPQHVYVVAADGTGTPRNLTPGPYQHHGVSWLADSSGVVTAAARHDGWDRDLARTSTSSRSTARSGRSRSRPGTYGHPSVSPDGTTRRLPRRRRPDHRPAERQRRRDRRRRRRAPLDLDGARPHVQPDRRASGRRCGSTTTRCWPPPRTAATRTSTELAADGRRRRSRSPTGRSTVHGFDAAGGHDRDGPGDRRAPGRARHARRSGHAADHARFLGWEKFTVPYDRRHRRDRRLDHAPGGLRRVDARTRCCSTSTAGRSRSTARRSSTRRRCRPPPASSS